MNPCPCGFCGDAMRECRCTPQQIAALSRAACRVRCAIASISPSTCRRCRRRRSRAGTAGESSATVRARVVAARDAPACAAISGDGIQDERRADAGADGEHCALDRRGRALLDAAIRRLALSARGYDRVPQGRAHDRGSRGRRAVAAEHVAEALQFRMLNSDVSRDEPPVTTSPSRRDTDEQFCRLR